MKWLIQSPSEIRDRFPLSVVCSMRGRWKWPTIRPLLQRLPLAAAALRGAEFSARNFPFWSGENVQPASPRGVSKRVQPADTAGPAPPPVQAAPPPASTQTFNSSGVRTAGSGFVNRSNGAGSSPRRGQIVARIRREDYVDANRLESGRRKDLGYHLLKARFGAQRLKARIEPYPDQPMGAFLERFA